MNNLLFSLVFLSNISFFLSPDEFVPDIQSDRSVLPHSVSPPYPHISQKTPTVSPQQTDYISFIKTTGSPLSPLSIPSILIPIPTPNILFSRLKLKNNNPVGIHNQPQKILIIHTFSPWSEKTFLRDKNRHRILTVTERIKSRRNQLRCLTKNEQSRCHTKRLYKRLKNENAVDRVNKRTDFILRLVSDMKLLIN